jgi:hypothetical protein
MPFSPPAASMSQRGDEPIARSSPTFRTVYPTSKESVLSAAAFSTALSA